MKKGDRVRVESQPDWGLGHILSDPANEKVEIHFTNAGRKIMSTRGPLIVVSGADAVSRGLDNLKTSPSRRYRPFADVAALKKEFLRLFPEGFSGSHYYNEEREYKLAAHKSIREMFEREYFERLLASGQFPELKAKVKKLVRGTNLINEYEAIQLSNGLEKNAYAEAFYHSLFELLFDTIAIKTRFEAFCARLQEVDAPKWTIATYFLFLMYPTKHMFLKPLVTQLAADICSFELNYKPQLNWLTYDKLVEFSEYLFEALADLKPRDMIDIQSFIWCTLKAHV